MQKGAKWAFAISIVVLVTVYTVYTVWKPLEVELLQLKPQTITQTFKEQGVVVSSEERAIYSEINGTIRQLYVKQGQQVQQGQQLADIDRHHMEVQIKQLLAQKQSLLGQQQMTYEDIKQQLAQLQAQLESVKGQHQQTIKTPYTAQLQAQQLIIEETTRQLTIAKEDVIKNQALFDEGLIAQQQLDDAKSYMQTVQNSLEQQQQALLLMEQQAEPLQGTDQYFNGQQQMIEVQITALQRRLSGDASGVAQYYQGLIKEIDVQLNELVHKRAAQPLVAPVTGVVKELALQEGMFASEQIPILTMVATEQLVVEVDVLTEDVVDVHAGMTVELTQNRRTGDTQFQGTVTRIAEMAHETQSALGLTEQRVTVTIELDKEVTTLRPGYAVDVRFIIAQQENQLAVPKVALFPWKDGDAVFVVRKGRVDVQPVITGLETADVVVVKKGLQAGDQIIKNPQLEGLQDGKRVK